MRPIWSEQSTVRSYDVGSNGLLKPQTLFQFFQEAASHHANDLGAGYDLLQSQGLFWALSRVKVEIAALPVWGDEVTLTTWPKGVDKIFAVRDFRMTDRQGGVLVKGTSCWLLVDVEKMRPRRVDSLARSLPLNEHEHALQESLGKIAIPDGLGLRYERKVMASDLDVNNHVNNTEYVRWIADALDPVDGALPSIRTLQINYLEEARLGDTIVFSAGSDPAGPASIFVEGVNGAKGAKVVQARVQLARQT